MLDLLLPLVAGTRLPNDSGLHLLLATQNTALRFELHLGLRVVLVLLLATDEQAFAHDVLGFLHVFAVVLQMKLRILRLVYLVFVVDGAQD